MSDTANANVYTEAQHFALLTSAVERETASLSEAKGSLETQVGTLESEKAALADELTTTKSRLDVIEAEKAAAEARADAAAQELVDFKAELALKAEIAEKLTSRVEAIKAANASLSSEFFTEERAQRWAEMSDEAFAALVADLSEAAACKPDNASCGGVDCGDKNCAACGGGDMKKAKSSAEQARESAAFAGGQTATSIKGETNLARLLGVRRRGPVS